MGNIKSSIKCIWVYTLALLKWIAVAVAVGAVGGAVGSAFHMGVDYATHLREENWWILLFLPIGGVAIAGMYRIFKSKGALDTNRVLNSVRGDTDVPLVLAPLIFVSTVITHFLGGSAGREGAALQLGGSIGCNLGKLFKLNKKDMRIVVMSGMSAVFAALFGTPVTAAVFSLEVTDVGKVSYAGLLPCVVSAITAYQISQIFNIPPVQFAVPAVELSGVLLLKVAALSVLCAGVSIAFCVSLRKGGKYASRIVPNAYLRAAIGGAVIICLTLLIGTTDYNGAGMGVISSAISGNARPEAFALKLIFTVITISTGFKGGEIVPSFFIGSTFGCVVGALLGMDAGFGAAVGFVTLFCGAVNCPLASIVLAVEVFGSQGLLYFAVACAISYLMSGRFSLYKSQRLIYSKLDGECEQASE